MSRRCLLTICMSRGLHLTRFQSTSVWSNLQESTQKKVILAYIDSVDYIKKLVAERERVINEINSQSSNQDHKRVTFLNEVFDLYDQIVRTSRDVTELGDMLNKIDTQTSSSEDKEMSKLVRVDLDEASARLDELKYQIIQSIIPEDQEDKEDAILELSAGVGGSEARLFCSELFNMYQAYANFKQWTFQPQSIDLEADMMRKAQIEISGMNVFKYLKFESGVHRVQRVPKTEAKGRIHTSTVGVVVSPKPSEIKIEIDPKDLRIEAKTHGGPGGQHANKTQSAIRITHLPTGIQVNCEEERHQHQNRARAMKFLIQRLYQIQYEEQLNKKQSNRKMQIGSSGRSERIRTYNYIQDRITDHRLSENFTGVARFLSAETLVEMIENLKTLQQVELLYELLNEPKT